jgi:hypothetical protein
VADSARPALLAALLLGAFALVQARDAARFPDFFIYRLGSELAVRGESPYDLAKVRARVADQFPEPNPTPESFVHNCGYFLPPGALVLFAPFAALPLGAAKVAWALVCAASGFAVARVPVLKFGITPPTIGPPLVAQLLPLLLLLNFLTIGVVMVGQTALACAGAVAVGVWCFQRGGAWTVIGCGLWAVPFVKPHVAVPLVPLAWFLFGWARAAGVVAWVLVLTAVGATLAGGSPLFVREYLDYLSDAHKAVLFNRAELNPEITSWNRLLFALTGVLVEQTALVAALSYGVWFALLAARRAFARVRPCGEWALAACAAGAVWCPQVLGYEALALVLVIPWARELFAHGHRRWGALVVCALAVQALSFQILEPLGVTLHRPLGAAVVALAVLCGPLLPVVRSLRDHNSALLERLHRVPGGEEHHARFVLPRLRVFHLGIGGDDDRVAGVNQVRAGPVHADHAAAARPGQRVRHQPRAVRHVPHVNLFVRQNVRRVEQIRVDGHAALVLDVRFRDRRAVQLRLHHDALHCGPPLLCSAAILRARAKMRAFGSPK